MCLIHIEVEAQEKLEIWLQNFGKIFCTNVKQ